MVSKCTIKDVAKHAGVSISTVSHVINNNYPVSDELRLKVEQAIDELDYKPHAFASSLRKGNTHIIGVIATRITNPSIMRMVHGIAEVVEPKGYNLFISSTDNDIDKEKKLLNRFSERMVDLIVVFTSTNDGKIFTDLINRGMPVIMVNRYISGLNIDMVTADQYKSSYDIVRYMIDRGHRRIMTTNPMSNLQLSIDRYNGYLDALKSACIKPDPDLILNCDFSKTQAYSEMKQYLEATRREDLPTGIFVGSGYMAEGVIQAICEAGLKIPDDISLTAYGDVWGHRLFYPRITFVAEQCYKIGQETGKLALRRLVEKQKKKDWQPIGFKKIIIPTYIFEGDSVKDIN
ncbi:MAG TPA: LacI family DNA-binding transcriptional regulator [Clostridia bacterium]